MASLLTPANHLFELARSGQRLPHIILAIVLTFIIVLVAGLGGGIIAVVIVLLMSIPGANVSLDDPNALAGLILPDTGLEQAIYLIFSFGPIFLILWGWLALFEKRPLWTIGLERAGMWHKYLRGLLVGLLMFVAAIGISGAFGFIAFEDGHPQQQGLAAVGGVLIVFLGWMVQGAAEEALTRGWLFSVIGARYAPVLGLIVSSVVFATMHGLNFFGLGMGPIFIGLALLNLFLFGVFTVLYVLYEGGLWGVFSIHTVWNWAQGNVFGFEVSGGPAVGGTLFNLMEVGPDAITGGPFGPEGGLSVTVVLVVSCVIVWVLGERRKVANTPKISSRLEKG